MTMNIWAKSLALTSIIEHRPFFLISGGEPTDHPNFLDFLIPLCGLTDPKYILILSNGLFLENEEFSKVIFDLGVHVQVTNDKRFYPKGVLRINRERLYYGDVIPLISPFGRAKNNKKVHIDNKAPNCFNLRSAMFSTDDILPAIASLRAKGYMCTPSINTDGSIVAGEAPECAKIGNVSTTIQELSHNLKNLVCDKCKQSQNLKGEYLTFWNTLNKRKG